MKLPRNLVRMSLLLLLKGVKLLMPKTTEPKPKCLKIALVIGSLGGGGAEKQIILLAKGLVDVGHDVQIITISRVNQNGRYSHFPDSQNLETCSGGNSNNGIFSKLLQTFKFAVVLFKYFRSSRPDVVHAWLLHSYILALPIAFVSRIPVRISARRGLWSGIDGRIWRYLSKLSNLFATHFTANSVMVGKDASSVEGIPGDKITVIFNMVFPDDRRAEVLSQPARVVVVANLISYKGHLDLLKAISLSDEKLHFILVGAGPMLNDLLLKVSELGIQSRVDFVGFHKEPIAIMVKSQFGVLASHSEGMPNVILEAHSVGLPMIATNVGGITELIQDSINGCLVNPHSPHELASVISWMSQNPIERHRLSLASLNSIKKNDPQEILRQYEELYRALVESV
jgi:glycosyltransferase involved in cell wall biosynthesis